MLGRALRGMFCDHSESRLLKLCLFALICICYCHQLVFDVGDWRIGKPARPPFGSLSVECTKHSKNLIRLGFPLLTTNHETWGNKRSGEASPYWFFFFPGWKRWREHFWSWLRGLFQHRLFVGTHTEVPLVIPAITEEQWCQSCWSYPAPSSGWVRRLWPPGLPWPPMGLCGRYRLKGCRGEKPAQGPKSSMPPPEVQVQHLPSETAGSEEEGFIFLELNCNVIQQSVSVVYSLVHLLPKNIDGCLREAM